MPDRVAFTHPWDEDVIVSKADVTVGGTPSTTVARYWGGNVPWMSSGDVHLRRISDVPGRITEGGLQASAAKMVEPPAVAIALAGQGKTRGTAALTEIALCTNQSVALIKSRNEELDALYLYYALDYRYEELRARSAGGGRAGLTKQIVQSVPIPLPQPKEQSRIAEILDTLDAAIRETEAVVAKLRQVKAGLLHDLLTCGLDEHGHLRDPARHPEQFQDSRVGVIPKDWQARECKELFSLRSGNTPSRGEFRRYYENGTIPWVKTLDLNESWITDTDEKLTTLALQVGSIELRPTNTVLIAMYGGWEQIGRTGILAIEAATNQAVCALARKTNDIEPEFAFRAFQHRRFAWRRVAASSRKDPNITKEDIATFLLPVPKSTDEQKAIAARVRDSEQGIDVEETKLSKLHSLKRGLAHDLLTGRVRVKL